MDGFVSAELKLARAGELLGVIDDEIEAWRQGSTPYLINSVEPSDTGQGRDLVVRIGGLLPISPGLVLAVDDALHHMRSALDHVIWQLVDDNGGTRRRQAFPVLRIRNDTELARATQGATEAVREVVDRFQPYQQQPPSTFRNSVTWVLHQLDVVSKHRSIVEIVFLTSQVEMETTEGMVGRRIELMAGSASVDQPPFVRVHDIPQDFDDPGNWIVLEMPQLAIAETADYVGGPLGPILRKCERWSTKIVAALKGVRP